MNKITRNLTTGIILSLSAGTAFAHGESIRGGGGGGAINAVGAEILDKKVISFRVDGRRYSTFTEERMVEFKQAGEDVHMHSEEDGYFLSLGFPVSDDMDINILAQFNNFKGFKDNGDAAANECFNVDAQGNVGNPSTNCISGTPASPGIGDTLVTGRYRFYSSDKHQFASIFGVIIPTGTVTNVTGTGTNEIIGTHNQPGSGAITFQGGLGYSGHVANLGITADVIARAPTQGAKQFQTGRSFQADIAASYTVGKFTPVIELNYIKFLQDLEAYEVKTNSGGSSLALSPGISYAVSDSIGVFANYSFLKNWLTGISNDENYRFSGGVAYAFD